MPTGGHQAPKEVIRELQVRFPTRLLLDMLNIYSTMLHCSSNTTTYRQSRTKVPIIKT